MSNINNNLEENIQNKPSNETISISSKKSWISTITQWISNVKKLTEDVINEAMHHINWTGIYQLWKYIQQFTIVAVISIISLFIMDNIIVYGLKWIFI